MLRSEQRALRRWRRRQEEVHQVKRAIRWALANRRLEIVAAAVSLTGAGLNAYGHVEGFYLWLISNALWTWFALRLGRRWMAAMFVAYFVIAAVGIWKWSAG